MTDLRALSELLEEDTRFDVETAALEAIRTAAATVEDGTVVSLLSSLDAKKLDKKTASTRASTLIKKLEAQSATWGASIQGLMHPTLQHALLGLLQG